MNRYRKGADLERAAGAGLKALGFHIVRSAGSKSPIDLVAFRHQELVFAQAKYDGRLGPAGRRDLLDLAALIEARPVLVSATGPRGRRIEYFELTGPGPGQKQLWTPDHGFEGFGTDNPKEDQR